MPSAVLVPWGQSRETGAAIEFGAIHLSGDIKFVLGNSVAEISLQEEIISLEQHICMPSKLEKQCKLFML